MSCCNNFTDDDPQEYEAEISEHNNYLDFEGEVEDGEDGDFDNFLTKKMRARAKLRKKLMGEGLSRKDARQQAKSEIGKGGISALINKIKSKVGKADVQMASPPYGKPITPITAVTPPVDTSGGDGGGGTPVKKAGMQMPLIIGGIAVAGILGFLAYRKFSN